MGKAVAGGPGEVAAGGAGSSTFVYGKLGGTTGEQDRLRNPRVIAEGNKASKPLTENICAG